MRTYRYNIKKDLQDLMVVMCYSRILTHAVVHYD